MPKTANPGADIAPPKPPSCFNPRFVRLPSPLSIHPGYVTARMYRLYEIPRRTKAANKTL